jgi:methyltransferase
MTTVALVVAVVVGFILAEARISRRHERRLLAAGAEIPAGDVYRGLALSYPMAIVLMGAEGVWRAAGTAGVSEALDTAAEPSWLLAGLLLFGGSKALKYWAISALGERWTFRVVVLPGLPLVTDGPYRYVAHPNYVAVIGELLGTAMMVRAFIVGPVMIVVMAWMVWTRIRFEDRQLRRTAGGR